MNSFLRGSKKVLLGLGVASCGAAVASICYNFNFEDRRLKAASSIYENYVHSFFPSNNSPPEKSIYKWDCNWDKLDPGCLKKPSDLIQMGGFGSVDGKLPSEEQKQKQVNKAKSMATRNLIFIRHGQYNLSGECDQQRILTDLGRQQAALTGLRLRELSLPYSRIVRSTMSRATETAQIISKELPEVPMESCDMLREGAPFPPEPPLHRWNKDVQSFTDGARIEAAFRRYFHRAHPTQQSDSYELYVCHANVIRYFVCRALQLPPEAWLRFSLHNCSLTWIAIRPSGRVTVYSLGDSGHLPPGKMTTT